MLEYYRFKQIAELFCADKDEEAQVQLAELQRHYVALSDENLSYRTQMQEYEDILYLSRNLFFDNRFYWLVTGSIKQGPFCPECYNRDGLLMRLSGEPEERKCPYCQVYFRSSDMALAVPHEERQEVAVHKKVSGSAKVIPFQR